ncbi:MAG TPA: GNAT family N-acetyltransferase [Fimbriiglobus sp.]
MGDYAIRKLTSPEWPQAYAVIHELRTHLTQPDFLARTARMTGYGYELIGAFDSDGLIVGAMGYRPLETYTRGWHLHVDDLVTAASVQGRGVGTALLKFAEAEAVARGMICLFLDSRPTAETFYLSRGFARQSPYPMRKPV